MMLFPGGLDLTQSPCSQGTVTVCTGAKDGRLIDLGEGVLEVAMAPGDSGGPAFIDGKIAGVHSFGLTRLCESINYDKITNNPDQVCGNNDSYGELNGQTRVAAYLDWIDFVTLPHDLEEFSLDADLEALVMNLMEFGLSLEDQSFLDSITISQDRLEVSPAATVPEPTSIISLLAIGTLGATFTLKGKKQ